MITPRYYQLGALKAINDFFDLGGSSAIADIATGAGKSLLLSMIIDYCMKFYGIRILVLTHRKEIINQNLGEIKNFIAGVDVGVNSASIGRRNTTENIIFGGIASVHRQLDKFSSFDLLIIDECHLVPRGKKGMYAETIENFRKLNPLLKIIGLTATPYRLDSGRLDKGEGRVFEKTVYSYSISQGVQDGFLAPLISKATKKQLDVSNVAKRGGEFVSSDLIRAVNQNHITEAAVKEIIEYGADRNSWMVFCAGKDHAYDVAKTLKAHGVSAEAITEETKKRDDLIKRFSSGDIKALTCVDVLTTGFNVKSVDLIAMLRPTLSTSLYVQMVGRGTRTIDGKENCLVLDFAGNVRRHGPVDDISINTSGKAKEQDEKTHACPGCSELVAKRKKICPSCGYVIVPEAPKIERKPTHNLKADVYVDIMGAPKEEKWLQPTRISATIHKKLNKPDSLKITYLVGFKAYNQYLTIAHPGWAGDMSRAWWTAVMETHPPKSAQEALDRFANEKNIIAFVVENSNGFEAPCKWRISNKRGERHEINKHNTKKKLLSNAA